MQLSAKRLAFKFFAVKQHTLKYKSSLIADFKDIEDFSMRTIGVKMIVKVYLANIKEEMYILKNPLINGETVRFKKSEFQKVPILKGRFIVFFKLKNDTTKELFYIKPAKMNYHYSIR